MVMILAGGLTPTLSCIFFFIFNRRSSIGKEGAAVFQSSMSPIKDIDDSLIQSREVTFNKTPILPPIGQLTFASLPSDTHAGSMSLSLNHLILQYCKPLLQAFFHRMYHVFHPDYSHLILYNTLISRG